MWMAQTQQIKQKLFIIGNNLVKYPRKSNFAKLNTNQLFNEVDKDGNGSITLEEWLFYWQAVRHGGYSNKEIKEEVFINSLIILLQVKNLRDG